MAKRNGKYICNRCGCKIDTAHDLDCTEVRMFQSRSITEVGGEHSEKFSRVDTATKMHFCGRCMQDLLSHYVYGYEYKKPQITEEVIYCRECRKYLTAECPLCYIEKQTLQLIDMRNNFFCGYAERKQSCEK